MSSSTVAYASPLQPYHVRNLIIILRRANDHYTRVAEHIRASYVPSHHARTRARKLGLTVNVAKAVACDHRYVSTIPLPIIEQSPVVSITSSTSVQQTTYLSPFVPTLLTKTTPNGTTSAFSSASVYSSVSLASARSDIDCDDDIDIAMDDETTSEIQHPSLPNDLPIDAALVERSLYDQMLSEEVILKIEDASIFDSDVSPSASPSTVDSSGPATPNLEPQAIMLRIKRKSAEVTDYHCEGLGKRPKLVGVNMIDCSLRHTIRIPARKH